jgi:hypothetical protein
MAVVTDAEREAMARVMAIMNGESVPAQPQVSNRSAAPEIEIGGPGVVTTAEVSAMANVLKSLNKVTQQVMLESSNPHDKLDIRTSRDSSGVKVGEYKIEIQHSDRRLAGKQFYSIEHTGTGTVIANDITLYETALAVVKLLNNNHYVNHTNVRRLFELDDRYTSHRISAMSAKIAGRKAEQRGDDFKKDIYESKVQSSLDQALQAKKDLKKAIAECRL